MGAARGQMPTHSTVYESVQAVGEAVPQQPQQPHHWDA